MITIAGAMSFVRYAQRHRANPWLAAVAPFDIYVPGLEAWRVRLAEELTAQLDSMKPLDAVSQDVVRVQLIVVDAGTGQLLIAIDQPWPMQRTSLARALAERVSRNYRYPRD